MIRPPKSSNCPGQWNKPLAGDLFASSSRFLGRRSNCVKAAVLTSKGPFFLELKESAQEAFLHLNSSSQSFRDLNASDLSFYSEYIKKFGSEVWNSFLAPFNVYSGHWH
eukprot:jgi/Picsp_1/5744/NSC_03103-R1_---NA---